MWLCWNPPSHQKVQKSIFCKKSIKAHALRIDITRLSVQHLFSLQIFSEAPIKRHIQKPYRTDLNQLLNLCPAFLLPNTFYFLFVNELFKTKTTVFFLFMLYITFFSSSVNLSNLFLSNI